MTKNKVAQKLEEYNKWRRGDENYSQPNPKELGKVIDLAIKYLKQ